MISVILTWAFVCFVTVFGLTMLGATLTLLFTDSTRPRWYIAVLRAIGRRMKLEM